MKNKGLKMKRYSLFREGYNNLHEHTLTNVIGNLTLKEAEIIKRVLKQETSNVYKIEDDSELDWYVKKQDLEAFLSGNKAEGKKS